MAIDYLDISFFDQIIYVRKQSNPTPSLVQGVKISSLRCYYGAYGSDHPLCSTLLVGYILP